MKVRYSKSDGGKPGIYLSKVKMSTAEGWAFTLRWPWFGGTRSLCVWIDRRPREKETISGAKTAFNNERGTWVRNEKTGQWEKKP